MKRRQEISGIDTSMVGQELECPDSFMNSKRWEVPDFMNTLPIDIRGSVIYSVHAVLDNIVIGDREEIIMIHTHMRRWLESKASERSPESVEFLALQLQLAQRVLH